VRVSVTYTVEETYRDTVEVPDDFDLTDHEALLKALYDEGEYNYVCSGHREIEFVEMLHD
jgi:plastocyanin